MIGPDGKAFTQNEKQKHEPKDGYISVEYTGLISSLVEAVLESMASGS